MKYPKWAWPRITCTTLIISDVNWFCVLFSSFSPMTSQVLLNVDYGQFGTQANECSIAHVHWPRADLRAQWSIFQEEHDHY